WAPGGPPLVTSAVSPSIQVSDYQNRSWDITGVVQEIVNRPGWDEGNALLLLARIPEGETGDMGILTAEGDRPVVSVTYTIPPIPAEGDWSGGVAWTGLFAGFAPDDSPRHGDWSGGITWVGDFSGRSTNPPQTLAPVDTGVTIDYRYELYDRATEEYLGDLHGVVGGSHSVSAHAQVHSTGEIRVRDTGQVDRWEQVYIQPVVTINEMSWPLGRFSPRIPLWSYDDTGQRVGDVILADKTDALAGDKFATTFGVDAGVNLGDTITEIIESTGLTPGAMTDIQDTLLTAVEWDPDDTKLTAVNTILDAANFFSLWANGTGQFQVTPYVRPEHRPTQLHFVDGRDHVQMIPPGLYDPAFEVEHDLMRPNVFIVRSQGDDETDGLCQGS
ncbi:MAG TPA: hypothetical protein VK054_05155, partial [Beutenbergiaceae bacterium]|nr:hypothetical protein [Beutenbergiaceae bacterium]